MIILPINQILRRYNYEFFSVNSTTSTMDEAKFKINSVKNNITTHNKIRSLIFPPFQLPIYKGNKIKK